MVHYICWMLLVLISETQCTGWQKTGDESLVDWFEEINRQLLNTSLVTMRSHLHHSWSHPQNEYTERNTVDVGNCKKGWEKYDKTCYRIFSNGRDGVTDKTYQDAQAFCDEQMIGSGSLVSILNSHVSDFLVSYLGRPGIKATVYIGLRRSGYYHDFKWPDGSEMSYRNFVPGEPNNYDDSDSCVQMQSLDLSAGMWNDVPCSDKKGFICQSKPDPSFPTAEPEADLRFCLKESFEFSGKCYTVSLGNKTWAEAEQDCQSEGSHPVSMVNGFETAFVRTITHQYNFTFWIGLRANVSQIEYVDHKGRHPLEWSDHRLVHHLDWDRDEPKYTKSEGVQCVEMKENDRWAISDCSERKASICVKHSNKPEKKPKSEGLCPFLDDEDHQLIDVGRSYCYLVDQNYYVNWFEARQKCVGLGGDLAFFKEKWEWNLLRPYLTTTSSFNKWYLVGINSLGGRNEFLSQDGQSIDANMWEYGEPNSLHNEKCVVIFTQAMTLLNVPCLNNYNFICQVPKVKSQQRINAVIDSETTAVNDSETTAVNDSETTAVNDSDTSGDNKISDQRDAQQPSTQSTPQYAFQPPTNSSNEAGVQEAKTFEHAIAGTFKTSCSSTACTILISFVVLYVSWISGQ